MILRFLRKIKILPQDLWYYFIGSLYHLIFKTRVYDAYFFTFIKNSYQDFIGEIFDRLCNHYNPSSNYRYVEDITNHDSQDHWLTMPVSFCKKLVVLPNMVKRINRVIPIVLHDTTYFIYKSDEKANRMAHEYVFSNDYIKDFVHTLSCIVCNRIVEIVNGYQTYIVQYILKHKIDKRIKRKKSIKKIYVVISLDDNHSNVLYNHDDVIQKAHQLLNEDNIGINVFVGLLSDKENINLCAFLDSYLVSHDMFLLIYKIASYAYSAIPPESQIQKAIDINSSSIFIYNNDLHCYQSTLDSSSLINSGTYSVRSLICNFGIIESKAQEDNFITVTENSTLDEIVAQLNYYTDWNLAVLSYDVSSGE